MVDRPDGHLDLHCGAFHAECPRRTMVSKSHVHAARTSPIPGLVVIVLAVAAIFFGLAVVQKPRPRNDVLEIECIRLRAALNELQERTAALERQLHGAEPLRR